MENILAKNGRERPNLSPNTRQAVYHALLELSNNNKLKQGSIKTTANKFNISVKTVSRIWHQARKSLADGAEVADVKSRKKGHVGRKLKNFDPELIKSVPLNNRRTIRSLAASINVPKSTVHNRLKSGVLRRHSNAVKPFLTDANKIERLKYCLSMLKPKSLNAEAPEFIDMYDRIHVDEKWFYISKTAETYYLVEDEEEPHRACKSKRFLTKVMFLAAVARPRWNHSENKNFDGKLGIWPFVFSEPAKRSSRNRAAGTIETKAISNVTREAYKTMIIGKLLPAIQEKWPRSAPRKTIWIQQDNAKPHILPDDIEFNEASNRSGFKIKMLCQPPNSPDTNVLDLGFFNAIQSLQQQSACKTVDELIHVVENAFSELNSDTLNKVFLSHQQCMVETMKVNGGNNYKVRHMKKDHLQRFDRLPISINCDFGLYEHVQDIINSV